MTSSTINSENQANWKCNKLAVLRLKSNSDCIKKLIFLLATIILFVVFCLIRLYLFWWSNFIDYDEKFEVIILAVWMIACFCRMSFFLIRKRNIKMAMNCLILMFVMVAIIEIMYTLCWVDLLQTMRSIYGNPNFKNDIQMLQHKLECCGVNNFGEHIQKISTISPSCCRIVIKEGQFCPEEFIYKNGCHEMLLIIVMKANCYKILLPLVLALVLAISRYLYVCIIKKCYDLPKSENCSKTDPESQKLTSIA